MATSFNVNQADLAFILKQIRIAELHSSGMSLIQAIQEVYPGLSATDAAISPFGLRTVSGVDNNLLPGNAQYGAADTLFPRLTDPVFLNDADGDTISFGPNTLTNNNYGVLSPGGTVGSVVDADPRIISNLIVSMTVDNLAAIDAYLSNPLSVAQFEADHPGKIPVAPTDPLAGTGNYVGITNADLATIPNQSPDIGLSPGFNSWMTYFGQFFDHGLDLVTKGGNGTVYIPLQPDDPLYVVGSQTNFMALTRATVTLDANGIPQHENTTTSFVDQNQTYTSHASHQVFLRQYTLDGNGHAVSTGHLLDGVKPGSIANWGEVKAQALTMLGIKLDDFDVHNVPLLRTDEYGRFVPGPNGYAQVATDTGFVEGTATGLVLPANTVRTGHSFLNDIAHHAAPSFVDHDHNPATPKIQQIADSDLLDYNGDGVSDQADVDAAVLANVLIDANNDGFINTLDLADVNLDGVINAVDLIADDRNPFTYDNEMLDSHFLTGDGRGNENIALTSVHSIFHSEHNRLVEANKDTLIASGDATVVNEWLLSGAMNQITQADLDAINNTVDPGAKATAIDALHWNGERLFQAGRFATEMQYQHLVFEEFARRIQPTVAPFVFTNSPDLDASILAEFAHVVYRFGHSMLTGTVDRLENDLTTVAGTTDQATLLAAFLNPQMYLAGGQTIEEINANLIRGLTRDVGNEIDEFIVQDVRSNLLGLPLDLAALNIARGREAGVGSLNTVRAQLYNDFGSTDLKPYTSWTDFAQNLKHPTSVVNFIAAYGTHSSITSEATLAGKRNAAMLLVFGGSGAPSDRLAFMNGTGAYADLGGLNTVDLWIGGLAEAKKEFGGMLGSTFGFIFQYQMEHLQNGDRLYYLSRTQGTNLLNQLEPNTFTDLVMRNTDLGGIYSTHLNGALFVTPDRIYELDSGIAQEDYDPTLPGRDEIWSDPNLQSINPKVVRSYAGATQIDVNGVMHDVGGYFKFSGGEHVVLGGTEGDDTLLSDKGVDTLWGDGGNDYLNAGSESDNVFGGEGDDIIVDPFGDDVLRGNQGNDVISGGVGLDLLFGDQGSDYIITGTDATEVFAGQDNDFILGNGGGDNLLGNEGDDWLEGGEGFDTLTGENSELFFNSPIVGHDVLWGQGNDTDYDGESGDDIMFSGPGIQRNEGMWGFDWGIAKYDPADVNFNLALGVAFPNVIGGVLRDRFDFVEAASGWKHNDTLEGDERGRTVAGGADPLFVNDTLTAEGIDRINGFRSWFGFGTANPTGLDTILASGVAGATTTEFRNGNILLGGDGNDTLQGRGGYDLLDGDSWLNVRIKINIGGGVFYYAESLNPDINVVNGDPLANAGKVTDALGVVQFGGKSLNLLMLDRTLNPGQLSIVREILTDTTNPTGPSQNVDTAVFRGNLAEYDIEGRVTDGANGIGIVTTAAADLNGDGFISITDRDTGTVGATIVGTNGLALTLLSRGTLTDETDLIKNIENLRFADQTIAISGPNQAATGTVNIAGTLLAGQVLTASLAGAADLDGLTLASGQPAGLTFEWQTLTTGANPVWYTLQTSSTYTVRLADVGHTIRAVAVFKDNAGVTERIHSATTLIPVTDPTDIRFTGVTPGPAGLPTASTLPPTSTLIGNLSTTDNDTNAGFVYTLLAGSSPDFTVSAAGAVTRINSSMLPTTTYTLIIKSTDITGGSRTETFTIRTGSNAADSIPILALTNDHIIYGVGANDTLTGNVGDDNILGQAGDDRLDGGAGQDILDGGVGNDTLVVDNIGDVVIENAASGTDTVESSITYTLGVNLENLTLTGTAALNGTGNAVANTIRGNSGNNILDGGLGNDTMIGLAGDDTYIVDSPADIVTEALGAGTDTVQSSVTYTLSTNVENLTLTGAGAINGTGNTLNNILIGNSADNTLSGLAGADAMSGGLGNDTYIVDNSLDTVTEGLNEGTDTVNSSATFTLGANVETLVLTGGTAINGTGNADANTLLGNTGANTLNGGGGADTMSGGLGNDTINGDAGNDIIRYAMGDGADTVNGGLDSDTLAITGAVASDNLAVTFNGTSITNFAGGTVTNVESVTADLGAGSDTLTYTAPGSVTVNLALGIASGFTSIANIENVTGGIGNDSLTGDGLANTLTGGTGNDTLGGSAGNDLLVGGAGGDVLTGGADADNFRLAVLTDSLLANYDRITDLAIGTDSIEVTGAFTIAAGNVIGRGSVGSFSALGISAVLTGANFGASQAATFTFGGNTFLALNNGTAGFQANTDAIIDITGFSGNLANLAII
jgi:Ca2+-binding RTX toxin-like protein